MDRGYVLNFGNVYIFNKVKIIFNCLSVRLYGHFFIAYNDVHVCTLMYIAYHACAAGSVPDLPEWLDLSPYLITM